MRDFFWLSDEAWAAIEPHMPKNQPGARRVDDRRVISGIVHVLKTGCRWRDCPQDYGPHTTIYNRFNRWSRRQLWLGILQALVSTGILTQSSGTAWSPPPHDCVAYCEKKSPRVKIPNRSGTPSIPNTRCSD